MPEIAKPGTVSEIFCVHIIIAEIISRNHRAGNGTIASHRSCVKENSKIIKKVLQKQKPSCIISIRSREKGYG